MSAPEIRRAGPEFSRRREWIVALAAYVAMAIATTWPLALSPATRALDFWGDAILNAYILAWDQHALTHCPTRIFDANFMSPTPRTLCLSENMIVPAALTLPLAPLDNPVLVYNVVMLGALLGSAWAWRCVLRRWGLGGGAAWLGGLLFGFSPWRFAQLGHLQLWLGWWMPLALWGLDAWLRGGGWRWPLLAGAALAAQFYSCIYLFYFILLFGVAFVAVGLACERPARGRWLSLATQALGGLALMAALLAPAYRPYRQMHDLLGQANTLESLGPCGAVPGDYLRTPDSNLLYGSLNLWGRNPTSPWPWENDLCPGAMAILATATLPLLALSASRRRRAWGPDGARRILSRCLMLAAGGAFLVVLSFGPELHWRVVVKLPWYGWLFRWLPGFDAIRVPPRAGGAMAGLALSGLAAVAMDGWTRLGRDRRAASVLAGLLLTVGVVDLLNRPLPVMGNPDGDRLRSVRRQLGPPPAGAAEVDLPFTDYTYMGPLASGPDFSPLLNGVSGYVPRPNQRIREAFLARRWDARQWALLRRLRVARILDDRRRAAISPDPPPPGLGASLRAAGLLARERAFPAEDFVVYDLKLEGEGAAGLSSQGAARPSSASARPPDASKNMAKGRDGS
jgi:hypothetical protein